MVVVKVECHLMGAKQVRTKVVCSRPYLGLLVARRTMVADERAPREAVLPVNGSLVPNEVVRGAESLPSLGAAGIGAQVGFQMTLSVLPGYRQHVTVVASKRGA